MPDNCTIYCKDKRFREVFAVVRGLFPDLSLEGTEDEWSRIIVRGKKGEMRLTALVYGENGDPFSQEVGSMACMAESSDWIAVVESERQNIVDRLNDTQLVIGVVADPGFEADQRFTPLVFEIAFRLDGLVFNGLKLFNALTSLIMHYYKD